MIDRSFIRFVSFRFVSFRVHAVHGGRGEGEEEEEEEEKEEKEEEEEEEAEEEEVDEDEDEGNVRFSVRLPAFFFSFHRGHEHSSPPLFG